MNDHRFSRRYFFYGTLLAGAVPSSGFGSTPSLSARGYKSPNEKLNVAAVGMGARGPAILVCDVDEERSAHGFAQYPKAKKYKDYRKMFEAEDKNIDAVMIATTDNSYSAASIISRIGFAPARAARPACRTSPWRPNL